MSYKSSSTIVGPPADALAEGLESVAGDDLQLVAEYDSARYDVLFASERLLDDRGGVDGMSAAFDAMFPYYHLDFLQRELVEDMLWLGEVGTYVTFLDHGIVVRAQREESGVFVVLDVTASVDDVQVTIQNTLGDDGRRLPVHG